MFHILIAEDEQDIQHMMRDYLVLHGFSVHCASNGEEAYAILDAHHIDLLITDIMMPKLNGYALTRELRQNKCDLPILMITAKESIDDKEIGYNSGTDDYMTKPILLKEMLLRINALLRRANATHAQLLTVGSTTLDYAAHTATVAGIEIDVTPKEFSLLFKLLSQPNKIHTKNQLFDEIWGFDSESEDSTIKVHISKLRTKFHDQSDFEIKTIKGLGYKAVLL